MLFMKQHQILKFGNCIQVPTDTNMTNSKFILTGPYLAKEGLLCKLFKEKSSDLRGTMIIALMRETLK
jgi:hypothetical protein